MANIVLKTFAAGDDGQGTVTPQDDAFIYQNAIPMNGIFSGATVTLSEANVLHIAAGFGIIGGRFFEINADDISVELSSSGTLLGRLYIHLELTNADVPISIEVATGSTLPALVGDPDLNINDGAFDLELATFNVSEITISDIVNTFPTIRKANNQLRRATAYSVGAMAFCQSAADNLVFVCTTAGTTAVQQPMGYTSITDGNTITDGTAVFKAVDLIGAIDTASGKADNAQATANTASGKADIVQVQVSNSGDAYDSTKAYAVGDLCIHDDVLYRCITACSAGSWATNQSCFTADTLTGAINKGNEITQYTSVSSGTSSWTIQRASGYRQGKHHHFEVYGVAAREISQATTIPFFTFSGAPNNKSGVGTAIVNGVIYPVFASIIDGYVHESATGNIESGSSIAFIIDFVI